MRWAWHTLGLCVTREHCKVIFANLSDHLLIVKGEVYFGAWVSGFGCLVLRTLRKSVYQTASGDFTTDMYQTGDFYIEPSKNYTSFGCFLLIMLTEG